MSLRHPVRALALLATLALALPASATTPDPRNTTADLVVVGNVSGTPIGGSPAGFDVVVRDVDYAPLPGRFVTLDFSDTTMRVFAVQNAGTTLDCASRSIGRVTNGAGAVNFAARVSGFSNSNWVEVSQDGVVIAIVKGRSTDIDGIDGATGLGDFAIFGANFLDNQAAQETDYDLSGTTGLGDFALFGAEFLGSAQHAYCP